MDFCSQLAVKLLLEGLNGTENILTSPLSYNATMNMIAAGSSHDTLDQILRFLQHKNIEEVSSESSKFVEITSEQQVTHSYSGNTETKKFHDRATKYRKTCNQKIDDAWIYGRDTRYVDGGNAPIISYLNGIWVNQEFCLKGSFQELIEKIHKAKIRSIDCGKPELVVQQTNEWESASTNGLIKEVLKKEHISNGTRLILGNALYFKGSWEKPFDKSFTRCKRFYLLNGEEIEVPFMTDCKEVYRQSFEGFEVARIPYSRGGDVKRNFTMYIFLPDEKDGLRSLLEKVDSNPKFFEQHCGRGYSRVDIVWIPKFKFCYSTEESPKIMKGMGLTLPFDEEKAELHEMIKGEVAVHVSKIIQKAFIEVNEEGTEAAAVTFALTLVGSSGRPRPPPTKFIADHPFMFIIREISGILFFAGTVLNPLKD